MQLKITRSQRQTALAKTAMFCIDARVEFTAEELALVNKYKLGKEVIYNSAASRRHLDKADIRNDGSTLGALKGLASVAMAALQLNISVNSLQRGQHIECKDLAEVEGAEEALQVACLKLRGYLDTAATFDGHEDIYGFEGGKMVLLTARTPMLLPAGTPLIGPAAVPQATLIEAAPPYMDAPAMGSSTAEGSGSTLAFDDVLLKLQRFWDNATPVMRALVCVAAVAVVIILYQIL